MLTESAGIINTTHLREADEREGYPGNRDHGTGHPGLQKALRKKRDTARGGILTILSHQRDGIMF
jgi:hypothetical protein